MTPYGVAAAYTKMVPQLRRIAFVLCCLPIVVTCKRVLVINMPYAPSHSRYLNRLASQLVGGGHNVTILQWTMFSNDEHTRDQHADIAVINIESEEKHDWLLRRIDLLLVTRWYTNLYYYYHLASPLFMENVGMLPCWSITVSFALLYCKDINSHIQQLCEGEQNTRLRGTQTDVVRRLQNGNFDMILIDSSNHPCAFRLANALRIPYLSVSGCHPYYYMTKNVVPLSFVPSTITLERSDRMSFTDRVGNVWDTMLIEGALHMAGLSLFTYYLDRTLWHSADALAQSGAVANTWRYRPVMTVFPTHRFLDMARPGDMFQASGALLPHNSPTCKDDIPYRNHSHNGQIIYTTTTMGQSETFASDLGDSIYTALGEITESHNMSVLWRNRGPPQAQSTATNATSAEMSSNIHTTSWIQMNDVLNDPATKLIIGNGGAKTLIEAASRATPMLVIPLGFDQGHNGAKVNANGFGLALSKGHASVQNIAEAVRQIVAPHSSYTRRACKTSKMLQDDRRLFPKDRAYWWTEFALRRSKLQLSVLMIEKGEHSDYIQYFSVDVIATVLATVLFSLVCLA